MTITHQVPARQRARAGMIERALVSGTVASVVSTATLALLARLESKGAVQPTNSTSHVYWGKEAAEVAAADLRHSLPGYLIHHGSAIFWALAFEAMTDAAERSPASLARNAAAVMGTAALLDYGLLPKRLTPGFERVLSTRSTVLGFAGLAAGLVIGGLLARQRPSRERSRRS